MREAGTALTFANMLIELSGEMPIEKISVSELSDRCGISRKTFYYYFSGIPSLVAWMLRRDLGELLKEAFPEEKLVYERQTGGKKAPASSFPYYVRVKSGVRSLDHSEFFMIFAKALEGKRGFYATAFRQCGPAFFGQYLFDLYQPAFLEDIIVMLDGRRLSKTRIEFMSEFYARAFTQDMLQRMVLGSSISPTMAAERMGNHIHDALYREIESVRLSGRR